jgi:hypothetical protein
MPPGSTRPLFRAWRSSHGPTGANQRRSSSGTGRAPRVRRDIARHAEDVSKPILVALEYAVGIAGGVDGHWISPCGWYLKTNGGRSPFERHLAEPGCSCGGSWLELTDGVQRQDGHCCRLQPLRRSAVWQMGVTLTAGHSPDPRCRLGPLVREYIPQPDLEHAEVSVSRCGVLAVSIRQRSFSFRRLR